MTRIWLRRLRSLSLVIPLAFGASRADWTLTNGPGSKAGRTEVIFGKGADLFAGTNGGGAFRSSDQGATWTAINDGFSIYLAIICMASIDRTLFAGSYLSGVYRSEDDGKTWTASNSGVTNSQPTAFALKGPDLFVSTSGGGVFRSTDKGATWKAAGTGITDYFVQRMIVSGSDLFIGTQTGLVYRSSDNGDSWTAIRTVTGSDNGVTGLAVIGSNLFVGTKGNGVFVSSDMGAAWKASNSGLSTLNIHDMKAAEGHLFVGTSSGGGFFHSADNAATWTQEIGGLTDKDLQSVSVIGSDLYAGTYGKVWRRPLSELGVVAVHPSRGAGAAGFAPDLGGSVRPGARIGFRLAKASRVDLSVFGMDGKRLAILAQGNLAAGDHQPVFTAAGFPAGLYCFRLQVDGTGLVKTMRLE